jgi:hypothetical protein
MPSSRLLNRLGQAVLGLRDNAGFGGALEDTSVPITDSEPQRATYGLFVAGLAPAATPTDVIVLQGSATKVIRLKSIMIAGTATAAANVIAYLIRRSTANTGGTSTTPAGVLRDTGSDAVTATVRQYSANPSGLGTAVGTIDGGRLNLAPAANGSIDRLLFQYTWQMDQAMVLRGASEFLALNFNGAAWPAGGVLDISLMWTEE